MKNNGISNPQKMWTYYYVGTVIFIYMTYMTFLTYMTFGIWHACICQYECQKKRQDLRNTANHRKYSTQILLWPKIEISYFLIFPLYFSDFLCIFQVARELQEYNKNIIFYIFLLYYTHICTPAPSNLVTSLTSLAKR